MIKDCPIRKKKLAAKKPGQKHPFGCTMRQENIGTSDSPAEESNGEEAIAEEAEEDLHLAKEMSRCHTRLFHQSGLSDFKL